MLSSLIWKNTGATLNIAVLNALREESVLSMLILQQQLMTLLMMRVTTQTMLMTEILHYLKDPKLWELWYISDNRYCRISIINRIILLQLYSQ